jgi:hypothetical protein
MHRLPILLPLLALAACKAEKPDWAQEGRQVAVPPQVCGEIAKGMARLRATPGVEVGDNGEATMPVNVWNAMTQEQHDGFVKTLAFAASCRAGTQSDAQNVVVHGDDGTELARRAISTRVDGTEILRDQ